MRNFLDENIHATSHRKLNWNSINWEKVEKKVKELQIRIAKAVREGKEYPGHLKPELAFEVLEPVRGETCLHGSSGAGDW